jgi:branched-chain amino acid transport system permease protein
MAVVTGLLRMSLTTILQAIAGGLLLGGVYALLAAGLTLIFGVMRVINFAQAEFMMLGMFVAYFLATALNLDPLLLTLPVGVGVGLIGLGVALGLLERVPRGDQNAQLILTLGVSLILQNLALVALGPTPRVVVRSYTNAYWSPAGLFINHARLYACVASLLIMGALYLFLTRTWTGRAMRATADDPVSAGGVGINVRRTHVIAFMVGSGLAGLAGTLMVTFIAAAPSIGNDFIVIIFLAVVLGGLGSVVGATFGAFLVGLVQSLSGLLLPLQLQNVTLFIVFVAILLVRPQGLFGFRQRV